MVLEHVSKPGKGQEMVRKTSKGVPTVVYPKITARNILETMLVIDSSWFLFAQRTHFLRSVQFCGCKGSSGPSNSTTYCSCSGKFGGYSLPPPKFGRGLFDFREVLVLPTVVLCWVLCVSMRSSSVGCLSRSRWVFTLDMAIGSRTMDADEEEAVEPTDVVVSRLGTLSEAAPGLDTCARLFGASAGKSSGKRSGLASRSAFSRSRSTLSIEYGLWRNDEEFFEVF